MRAFVVAAALSLLLAAAPTYAQAPAPAPAPVAPAAQAGAPEAPFPAGAKYAFVNIQRIAAESQQGKALSARVQQLNQQKVTELNDKNKALQTAQQKLDSGASVLSEGARAQLAKDIDRQQTEIQRFTDDAQKEVEEMQNELQAAGAEGFEYRGQSIFSSMFGGKEVVVILEQDRDATSKDRWEYRLLATSKTSTMQRELSDTGAQGFEFVGMTVASTAMGGNELVTITRRKVR